MSATTSPGGASAPPDEPVAPPEREYESPSADEEPKAPELEDDGLEDEDNVPGPREEDDEEVLEPKVNPVLRVLVDQKGAEREFTQGPFLYFQRMEMYGLLSKAVNVVIEGENGLGMDQLFQMMQPKSMIQQIMSRAQELPGADEDPNKEDKTNPEDIVKMAAAFSRLISSSPEILLDFHCIVLDVPKGLREWAVLWGLPRMTIETGDDIMHTFIDQNWWVMEDFFAQELPKLLKRASKARQRHKSTGGRSKR